MTDKQNSSTSSKARKLSRQHASDISGVAALLADATIGVSDTAEQLHHTIQQVHLPLGKSRASRTKGLTGVIYKSVRGTSRFLGAGVSNVMQALEPWLPEKERPKSWESYVSILNGVYGDYLEEACNPLALDMTLRYEDTIWKLSNVPESSAQLPSSGGKVMLIVHGACLNHRNWGSEVGNPSRELALELGYTPLYLCYNTGLSIYSNGRKLAATLEDLLSNWHEPVTELVLIGHSMGGLVSRSACFYAEQEGLLWLKQLKSMVFIGSPHLGAPLEKLGSYADKIMQMSPYSLPFASLGKRRSNGIKDLRSGRITEASVRHKAALVPLPTHVNCYAMAASLSNQPSGIADQLLGDGLVPVESALAHRDHLNESLAISPEHQWVGYGMGHMEMLRSPVIFSQIRAWLSSSMR